MSVTCYIKTGRDCRKGAKKYTGATVYSPGADPVYFEQPYAAKAYCVDKYGCSGKWTRVIDRSNASHRFSYYYDSAVYQTICEFHIQQSDVSIENSLKDFTKYFLDPKGIFNDKFSKENMYRFLYEVLWKTKENVALTSIQAKVLIKIAMYQQAVIDSLMERNI